MFMKSTLYVLLFSIVLLSCQKKDNSKIYIPRVINANESFNDYPKDKENAFSIVKYDDSQAEPKDSKELFGIKLKDTTISIQTNANNKNEAADKFTFAEYLNTQKSSLLVQIADKSGLTAPFYLITLKDDKVDIISLFRPSKGAGDKRFTKGVDKIGRSGYLVNNDFFVTTVDAKVYLIRRQDPDERIQGLHFVNSPDKKTLVFLVSSSFYEVYYPTGEVFIQPLTNDAPKVPEEMYKWVVNNYSWQKNDKGMSFLKANVEDNRVRDSSEFK